MSRRILVLGSSHAATLYLAKEVFAQRPSVTVDWFVTPANLEFQIDQNTTQISSPPAYSSRAQSNRTVVVGGRDEGIFASDYDAIIYSAIGLRPVGVLKSHPARALAKMPVSEGLLNSMVREHENMRWHRGNLEALRSAGFEGRVICEPWIRPIRLPAGMSMEHWTRFCDAEAQYVGQLGDALNCEVLPRPQAREYLSAPKDAANQETDATHGSRSYAISMVNRLLDHLDVEAERQTA
ncbi:hypothetical protein SAMN05421688_1336 [Poseidonocella pacifica]|uniref:Uncharacterized protein n=1 Tax=Poseidonocella pacifica TaxID=871651 RepID=A0A1I0WDZ3_9RHOB|nr:hypothetical protein [Poseidonocella pacifica]SFA86975.1 hypothetical protein SAMN05421688_1336 [Poseidonocella pacifica]